MPFWLVEKRNNTFRLHPPKGQLPFNSHMAAERYDDNHPELGPTEIREFPSTDRTRVVGILKAQRVNKVGAEVGGGFKAYDVGMQKMLHPKSSPEGLASARRQRELIRVDARRKAEERQVNRTNRRRKRLSYSETGRDKDDY